MADYFGITWEKIDAQQGVFWPCPSEDHPGTPQLFTERFNHPDGRAHMIAVTYRPAAEEPSEAFPFRLTSGRVVYHYLSGNQTRRLGFLNAQAPDWQLVDDACRIERNFRFKNFREALSFVQEVGELAEVEGHHPNISFGWGNATVSLQTKKIKGLHENDFIIATKIDRIFARTATA